MHIGHDTDEGTSGNAYTDSASIFGHLFEFLILFLFISVLDDPIQHLSVHSSERRPQIIQEEQVPVAIIQFQFEGHMSHLTFATGLLLLRIEPSR